MQWILDLPDDLPLKLDGTDVVVQVTQLQTQDEVTEAIDSLLTQYDQWEKLNKEKIE